ncbi:MAG: DUF2269 domain-containing protein [Rhizobiaceae bacterium]|nr:DUF2269 domain-containing protein [Rhizobiaceae bacterium]
MSVEILRFLHVIGSTVLFGTGLGIAFFMVMAHRTGDPVRIAHVAGTVVVADTIFTATAVIIQPITGILLAHQIGWPLTQGWIVLSMILYLLTGIFWLPVVAIQIRLRNLARAAAAGNQQLPDEYYWLYRVWFVCGFPAFFAVLGIFWLMLTKPEVIIFT